MYYIVGTKNTKKSGFKNVCNEYVASIWWHQNHFLLTTVRTISMIVTQLIYLYIGFLFQMFYQFDEKRLYTL